MNSSKLFHVLRQNGEHVHLQNKLFESALEALTHAFYVIDVNDYSILIANSATAQFGKLAPGVTCHLLTHKRDTPCDGDQHRCPLQDVVRTKKPVSLEHIHYDKQGNARIYELHGYPIFDETGNVIQMIEYSLDITERRRAEEELQTAHEELERHVQERTAELQQVNQALIAEISQHKQTEITLLAFQEKLRLLAAELALTEERQRRRFAADLHDSVGQSLAVTKMKLNAVIATSIDSSQANQLRDIFHSIEKMIDDIRTLTFEISPPILYELGFVAAVEWLSENFQEQYNLKIHFAANDHVSECNTDKCVVLFRIVREALLNVVKHAHAKSARISLTNNANQSTIEICDDGVGFDAARLDTINGERHFGLFYIRERLQYLGGNLQIVSSPGQGTRLRMSVPIDDPDSHLSK